MTPPKNNEDNPTAFPEGVIPVRRGPYRFAAPAAVALGIIAMGYVAYDLGFDSRDDALDNIGIVDEGDPEGLTPPRPSADPVDDS
ncbi:MAG: hypothetical protein AAGA56_09330 [Myxococcota bacterium]